MAEVMIIQGKTETIWDNEDFSRMLQEKLGPDAADYFRKQTDVDTVLDDLHLADEDILDHLCSGECDRVHETQEHFEDLLKEIQEYADQIYQKILEGYTPGNRRTKKEQFALDQAIQIHNLIQKNT